MIRAAAFLWLALSASPAEATVRDGAPVMLRRKPAGWAVATKVTVPMRKFADSMLVLKLGAWRERRIDGRRVAGRVEMHYWPDKGWHRGVTLYVPRARKLRSQP